MFILIEKYTQKNYEIELCDQGFIEIFSSYNDCFSFAETHHIENYIICEIKNL